MTKAKAGLMALAIAWSVNPATADPMARRFAQDSCRQIVEIAKVYQHFWEKGQSPMDKYEAPPKNHATAAMAYSMQHLFSEIRWDRALKNMSRAEYLDLVGRVCEPIYEVYFDHLQRRRRSQ